MYGVSAWCVRGVRVGSVWCICGECMGNMYSTEAFRGSKVMDTRNEGAFSISRSRLARSETSGRCHPRSGLAGDANRIQRKRFALIEASKGTRSHNAAKRCCHGETMTSQEDV